MSEPIDTRPPLDFNPLEVLLQIPAYVSLFDTEGRYVWINHVSHGWHLKDLIGRTLAEIGAAIGADFSNWYHAFNRALVGETVGFTLDIPTPGQPGRASFRGTLAPLRRGGEIVGALAVAWEESVEPDPLLETYLSATGRSVVRHLLTAGKANGAQIGAAIGEEERPGRASAHLRAILSRLVERGVLTRGRAGYAVSAKIRAVLAKILKTDG